MTTTIGTCSSCGQTLPTESRFCMNCGRRVVERGDVSGTSPEKLQRALGVQYEVRGEIGRGGFGIVYSVQDLRLERKLAVKVIRPEFVASDVIIARFHREAKIVAQLNHQNVLSINFAGEGEGLVYCAMPQIVGDTLRERLRDHGKLSIAKALRVFGEIARGLDHAHGKGIIHRDVTPANIMLDGLADDRAVLLDFGIAKALQPTGGKLSISGQVIGSPEYMSPERRVAAKGIDARSDVYSMGVVAFEMLTSRLPYRIDGPKRASRVGKRDQSPDPRAMRPDVPENFATAIARCIMPAPEDRWSSALEAARAAGSITES